MPFSISYNLLLEARHEILGTEINRPFVRDFMLIGLGARLCFTSAVVTITKVFSATVSLFLSALFITLGFLSLSPQRESLSLSSVSCNPLDYWSSVGVVIMYRGEQVFHNPLIKLQSFSGPMHVSRL